MPQLQLTEGDLSETLSRAREIAERGAGVSTAECEALLAAGEEMGIPRDAILQALRERLPAVTETFVAGQQVFAPSVDGHWHPATIVTLGTHSAAVQFHNGGEHSCAVGDLRPLSFPPGRKV